MRARRKPLRPLEYFFHLAALAVLVGSSCAVHKNRMAKYKGVKLPDGRSLASANVGLGARDCLDRTEAFLRKKFTIEQKLKLCRSATQEEPINPLVCFESVGEHLDSLKLSDEQKISLCSGVRDEPMAPVDCYEEADDVFAKTMTSPQKIKLCEGVTDENTAPVACVVYSEDLIAENLKTEDKINLCAGASENGLQPLHCFNRVEGVGGKSLAASDKIRVCAKYSNRSQTDEALRTSMSAILRRMSN
ncbi:MAG: hypothetical protein JNL01_03835 [Bdellovibrionales bacterium]|nr:hypothetical protein [Bdellovibrionales bacterium]